jgi:hypothetical protein
MKKVKTSKENSWSTGKEAETDRHKPKAREITRSINKSSEKIARDDDRERNNDKETKDPVVPSKSKDAARSQRVSLEKMKAERLGNDVYKNLIQVLPS